MRGERGERGGRGAWREVIDIYIRVVAGVAPLTYPRVDNRKSMISTA